MSIHAANLKLRDELFMAKQAIARVRDLHKPEKCDPDCCTDIVCAGCQYNYPCPTIKALDGEQG
ncbi:MAG: hypothetical protein EBR82_84715 [Caulobacteraceae bacterium]|nr:hypothetical protein [Caulobacteraceae bacterium]